MDISVDDRSQFPTSHWHLGILTHAMRFRPRRFARRRNICHRASRAAIFIAAPENLHVSWNQRWPTTSDSLKRTSGCLPPRFRPNDISKRGAAGPWRVKTRDNDQCVRRPLIRGFWPCVFDLPAHRTDATFVQTIPFPSHSCRVKRVLQVGVSCFRYCLHRCSKHGERTTATARRQQPAL